MRVETVVLTLLALVAFALNSLLTRLALGANEIDAATFTLVRLSSGAVVLVALVVAKARSLAPLRGGGAVGPLSLFAYAAPFSFAYLRIGAAVGALVLFGVVQLTMLGFGVFRGDRPNVGTSCGLALALGGFALLTLPAVDRPDPLGVALMAVAGVAWGVYTLAGRSRQDPLASNARSFLYATPLGLVILLATQASDTASVRGLSLAVISGGVTSGLGYAVWYRAVPRLSVLQASVAQLSVPVIAAVGAAVFLNETLGLRFLVAGTAVVGGVALVLAARSRPR
jgi:drug/metabolite transporter (DMT)-like permease